MSAGTTSSGVTPMRARRSRRRGLAEARLRRIRGSRAGHSLTSASARRLNSGRIVLREKRLQPLEEIFEVGTASVFVARILVEDGTHILVCLGQRLDHHMALLGRNGRVVLAVRDQH